MGIFSRRSNDTSKNTLNSDEYERLAKRVTDLTAEIILLKGKNEVIQTGVDNLRGNFNRKLRGLKEEDQVEEKPKEKETETINKDDFVAFG